MVLPTSDLEAPKEPMAVSTLSESPMLRILSRNLVSYSSLLKMLEMERETELRRRKKKKG